MLCLEQSQADCLDQFVSVSRSFSLFIFLCNFAKLASSILGDVSELYMLNLRTKGFQLNSLLLVMNMSQISRQHHRLS